MNKLIYKTIFISLAFILFNCNAANVPPTRINNHVYTAPDHIFTVNIPYIPLANKRAYMSTNEGITRYKTGISHWIDFTTPPQLKSNTAKRMFITVELATPPSKGMFKNDKKFYEEVKANADSNIQSRIQRLFGEQTTTKLINSKKLRINGIAAYQFIGIINNQNVPQMKGIFTYLNYPKKIAFVSILPILPQQDAVYVNDKIHSDTLYWNEYNQVLNTLKAR